MTAPMLDPWALLSPTQQAVALQARYEEGRKSWTETVGAEIAAYLASQADELRANNVDPADTKAVAAHMHAAEAMRAMQEAADIE